mmetsp:Transcript_28722/g.54345  ORF Transcript_28722/g.54345 Transcript_28722/m.54345 type:complete len:320 (-) Transcript_28722:3259-4218(-)
MSVSLIDQMAPYAPMTSSGKPTRVVLIRARLPARSAYFTAIRIVPVENHQMNKAMRAAIQGVIYWPPGPETCKVSGCFLSKKTSPHFAVEVRENVSFSDLFPCRKKRMLPFGSICRLQADRRGGRVLFRGDRDQRNERRDRADLRAQLFQPIGLCHVGIGLLHLLQTAMPAGVVDIQRDGKDLFRQFGRLGKHLVRIPVGINAQCLVEGRPLVVAYIHRRIDRRQEELDPVDIHALRQLGIGLHQQGKGLAMGKLVIAPLFEPFENRVEAVFGMCLKMPEDRDVTGITDLFRQIGGVVDELGSEIGVFLFLRQKPKVHP